MSLLAKYAGLEKQLQQLQQQMGKLESDDRMAVELDFKDKLGKLMSEYDKTPAEVVTMLEARQSKPAARTGTYTRKRSETIYKNPHTGETSATKGRDTKLLKDWKEKYGEEEVKSWVVSVR